MSITKRSAIKYELKKSWGKQRMLVHVIGRNPSSIFNSRPLFVICGRFGNKQFNAQLRFSDLFNATTGKWHGIFHFTISSRIIVL